MGRLWEGMGMGGRGNDRWSRWQHSQPFTLNHYNHCYNYYNYYFYNYHKSQAPSSRGYEPFTLVRVAAMIVCYYLWWSEYLLQGLSILWYMPTIWSIKVCIVSYGSWLHVLHWYNAQIGSILPNTTRRHPLPFCSSIVNIVNTFCMIMCATSWSAKCHYY